MIIIFSIVMVLGAVLSFTCPVIGIPLLMVTYAIAWCRYEGRK